MTDGFCVERRAAKRTHVAPPKCTSEHCFDCQHVRQGVFFEGKKPKKAEKNPVFQLLLLIQTRGEGGGREGGSECQRFSVLSVTNCQRSFLRTFYCCIQMEHHGSHTAADSLSAMSVLYPVCQCIMKAPPLSHPPPLTPPRPLVHQLWEPAKVRESASHFLFLAVWGADRISVLTGSAPAPLNLPPRLGLKWTMRWGFLQCLTAVHQLLGRGPDSMLS